MRALTPVIVVPLLAFSIQVASAQVPRSLAYGATGPRAVFVPAPTARGLPSSHGPLADLPAVFAFIAETTALGKGDDTQLTQRLTATSSIDRLHDYSGESIVVVKPELLGDDGKSRVRSKSGNYPFFVFRETHGGYVPLGQMEGRGYEWSLPNRHLQFLVTASTAARGNAVVRYEVNQAAVVNMTELAKSERRHGPVHIDVRNSVAG
ncbi:MAG TPA: hypothetical protein VGM84_07315 [Steroidobacteraceae bacterium]|jgi:hypothetical protein